MHQVFDIIELITRNDGTTYYELGNVMHNGRSELAAELGLIKEVRIIKLNIPHSQAVIKVENYVNSTYQMPAADMTEWLEWEKPPEISRAIEQILLENKVG